MTHINAVKNKMLATKTDFIKKLHDRKGYTYKNAREVVDDIIDIFPEFLIENGGIQIIGLGSLEVKTRKAKIGRNPRTNEEVPIPERKFIKFKAGKMLKEAIE